VERPRHELLLSSIFILEEDNWEEDNFGY